MGKTWNRDITFDQAEDRLVVTKTGANPDPDAEANRDPRYDTALEITTYDKDRAAPDKGAKILYHAKNLVDPGGGTIDVELTGITMKNGKPVPDTLTWTVSPKLLTLNNEGLPGTEWDYYVWGTADGEDKRTEDPKIRNHGP